MTLNRTRSWLGAIAAVLITACSAGHTPGSEATGTSQQELVTAPTLNTFIDQSLEIDQASPGTLDPHDANLFVGADPADGTPSYQVPTGGPATWIDWNDLGSNLANHQLMDVYSGKDPTSFPQSNNCVGPSNVLTKMDLTYVASANNSKFAYFAVQRAGNNGDAGYYWIFTKKVPRQLTGQCGGNNTALVYDISVGDVLLAGHFHPGTTPLLRVFNANVAATGVDAVSAIDYTNARWTENASEVAAVAVNETVTAPGSFGSAGVSAMVGNNLDVEVFAEAAVKLSLFSGNGSLCGATFYGSVITRSSGAGGTSPDLKDLAGPALFNFGSAKATATLQGSCTDSLTYSVAATGADGSPIANPVCSWVFDNGQTSSACNGTLTGVSPGSHQGSVTVTDPVSTCSATASASPASVFAPLGVTLTLTTAAQSCPSMTSDGVTYTANVTGGTGSSSIAWSGATCSGATCTIDPGAATYCASASLSASVSDTMGLCPPATSETETYSKVTVITASDN